MVRVSSLGNSCSFENADVNMSLIALSPSGLIFDGPSLRTPNFNILFSCASLIERENTHQSLSHSPEHLGRQLLGYFELLSAMKEARGNPAHSSLYF